MTRKLGSTVALLTALALGGCDGKEEAFPNDCDEFSNDDLEVAVGIPAEDGWSTGGLDLCTDDNDFYSLELAGGTLAFVEIAFDGEADLQLELYDVDGNSMMESDSDLAYERVAMTPREGAESDLYYLQVSGYRGSTGSYELKVRTFDWQEGSRCDGDDCYRIMQFPAPYEDDPYRFDSYAEFGNARRELILLVRYALRETYAAYPSLKPLGLIDMSERDGSTPGTAYEDLRHPEGTHIEGNDIDIAYFQTTPDNHARPVCANDGYFCTSESNTMDAEATAFFMAQLFTSSRVRVIGVDTKLEDDLQEAAEALYAADAISSSQRSRFYSMVASGSGWPFHHHHMHLSLDWTEGYESRMAGAEVDPYEASIR